MATSSLILLLCCSTVLYLLCQVQLSECQVSLVTRNVTDSFRIGEEGCKNDESICTNVQSSCQDNGLCLCEEQYPHFRNPVIVKKLISGWTFRWLYGDSYGCIANDNVATSIEAGNCHFKPFQLIPNQPQELATKFKDITGEADKVVNCFRLQNVYVKYPTSNSLYLITWLNDTYMEYNNIANGVLYFKWKKSVIELQGLIISIGLHCELNNTAYTTVCLEGKILGTWKTQSDVSPLTTTRIPATASTLVNSNDSNPPRTTDIATTKHSTNWSSTAARYSSTPNSKSSVVNESGYWKDVAISVSIVLSLIIVLFIIIVGYLLVRLRRKENNKEQRRNPKEGANENTAYEYPLPQYAGLENRGRDTNENQHVYQGLVGVHGNAGQPRTGNSKEMQPNNENYVSPSSNYESVEGLQKQDEPVFPAGLVGGQN